MTKAEALRTAADRIEGGAAYHWLDVGRCNCGHVAMVIGNWTDVQVRRLIGCNVSYTNTADQCDVTGRSQDEVMSVLLGIGFTTDDLRELEMLSNPRVRRLAGIPDDDWYAFSRKTPVVAYMRAWADLIDPPVAAPIELKPDARHALDRFATLDANDPAVARGYDRLLTALADA